MSRFRKIIQNVIVVWQVRDDNDLDLREGSWERMVVEMGKFGVLKLYFGS